LLQRFSDIYKRRDSGSAAQFFMCVEAMLEPYHQLNGGSGAVENTENDASNDEELELLRLENTRLSDELTVTMDTMSRMLNEYSTMFSNATPDEDALASETGMVLPEEGLETDLEPEIESIEDRELAELDEVELDISEEGDALVDSVDEVAVEDEIELTIDDVADVDGDLFDVDEVLDLDDESQEDKEGAVVI